MPVFRVASTTVIIWKYLWKQCPLLLKFESHSWLGLLNNSWFGDYLHLIYQNEFEVHNTTDSKFLLVLCPPHINKIYIEDQLRDIDLRTVVFSWLSCSPPPIYKIYHEDISEILCLYHIFLFCFVYFMWLIHSILSLVIIFREQNHVLWFNLIHILIQYYLHHSWMATYFYLVYVAGKMYIFYLKNTHRNDFRQNLQLKTYQNEGRITNWIYLKNGLDHYFRIKAKTSN
jgi:hypothetical protein